MWWPMIRKSKEEKTASEAEKKEIAELERQKRILEMEKLKSEIKKNLEDTTKSKWNRWMEAVKLGGKLFGQLVLLPVGAVQVAPVVADQATKFAESHAGAAKAAIVEKSTMPKVQRDWIAQDYRAKFRPLISAVETFYKSLAGKEGLPPSSINIDAELKKLSDESSETLDATIAFTIQKAFSGEQKELERAEREKQMAGLREGKLFAPQPFNFLGKLPETKTEVFPLKVEMRAALSNAILMQQTGASEMSVKKSLSAAANQFLQQLRQQNPQVYSAVTDPGVYYGDIPGLTSTAKPPQNG